MTLEVGEGSRNRRNARVFIVGSIAVTTVLYFVPYGHIAAYPLMLLSTFVHEMGHGLAGLLVGGEFERFVLNADGSGYALVVSGGGRFANAFVAAGGLVGPAVLAAGFFVASARRASAKGGLWLLSIVALVSCLLVVRNLFGLLFVGSLGLLCAAVAVRATASIAQIVLSFLGVQLALSVFSRGDYLFTDIANTAQGPAPSDVANMAQALLLPYWFWGAACGVFSVAVLVLGLVSFLRATAADRGAHVPYSR